MAAVSEDRQGVLGMDVGSRLLRVIVEHGEPVNLSELARLSGLSAPKVSRYLVSMLRSGLVDHDVRDNRYRLGPFALQIGFAAVRSIDVSALAEPILQNLCHATHQTVALSVWGRTMPVIVRCLEAGELVTVSVRLGAELPLWLSATGRCFAAFSSLPAVRRALDQAIRDHAGERQISLGLARSTIVEMLQAIRQQGYAQASDSVVAGFGGFCAPVMNHTGNMVAAITLIGSASHLHDHDSDEHIATLLRSAQLVSHALGEKPGAVRQVPSLETLPPLVSANAKHA